MSRSFHKRKDTVSSMERTIQMADSRDSGSHTSHEQIDTHIEMKQSETWSENLNKVLRIKERLEKFRFKWDVVFWIDYYRDTFGDKPSVKTFSEEREISKKDARTYITIYDDKEKRISKELDELLQGFDVYNDCVLFWSLILALLKKHNGKSLFRVFQRVAEISPASVSIKLLNKYKLELSRYRSEQVDKITQNIVIGSKYPMCTALRISKWYKNRASYDVSRAEEWIKISES
eukprot:1167628_1